MNNSDFERQRQNAVKQIREMSSKSTNLPPKSAHNPPATPPKQSSNPRNFNFDLPLQNFLRDKETALILGLLLILYGEKTDKLLLLALIYILL